MLKFMYNGIKDDGKLHKVWYSIGKLNNHPEGTITIYARDYGRLPQDPDLKVENNTDTMTDYFEKDRVRVTPSNKYYGEIHQAYLKQKAHNAKRWANRKVS